jgi:hypothetical protein
MTCNLNKLFEFYRNSHSNPAEGVRLATSDPAGRLVATYLTASQTYKDSLAEHKPLVWVRSP